MDVTAHLEQPSYDTLLNKPKRSQIAPPGDDPERVELRRAKPVKMGL